MMFEEDECFVLFCDLCFDVGFFVECEFFLWGEIGFFLILMGFIIFDGFMWVFLLFCFKNVDS